MAASRSEKGELETLLPSLREVQTTVENVNVWKSPAEEDLS